MTDFEQGGDAKAISRIAHAKFGGYQQMFEHFGWSERGSDMMRKVQTRFKEECGSDAAFVKAYEDQK